MSQRNLHVLAVALFVALGIAKGSDDADLARFQANVDLARVGSEFQSQPGQSFSFSCTPHNGFASLSWIPQTANAVAAKNDLIFQIFCSTRRVGTVVTATEKCRYNAAFSITDDLSPADESRNCAQDEYLAGIRSSGVGLERVISLRCCQSAAVARSGKPVHKTMPHSLSAIGVLRGPIKVEDLVDGTLQLISTLTQKNNQLAATFVFFDAITQTADAVLRSKRDTGERGGNGNHFGWDKKKGGQKCGACTCMCGCDCGDEDESTGSCSGGGKKKKQHSHSNQGSHSDKDSKEHSNNGNHFGQIRNGEQRKRRDAGVQVAGPSEKPSSKQAKPSSKQATKPSSKPSSKQGSKSKASGDNGSGSKGSDENGNNGKGSNNSPAAVASAAAAAAAAAAAGVNVCPAEQCSCPPCDCGAGAAAPPEPAPAPVVSPVVVPVAVPATDPPTIPTTAAPTTTQTPTTTTTSPCPPSQWAAVGNAWFYNTHQNLGFQAGEALCQQCGAHLPSFHDDINMNAFYTWWANAGTFWLGLNDLPPAVLNARTHTDGTPWDYFTTLADNSDHAPGLGTPPGYCVRVLQNYADPQWNNKWFDDGCDYPYAVVCKRTTPPPA